MYGVNEYSDNDMRSMTANRTAFHEELFLIFKDANVVFSYIRDYMNTQDAYYADTGASVYAIRLAGKLLDAIHVVEPNDMPDPYTMDNYSFSKVLSYIYCAVPQKYGLLSRDVIKVIPPESLWLHAIRFYDLPYDGVAEKAYKIYYEDKEYDIYNEINMFRYRYRIGDTPGMLYEPIVKATNKDSLRLANDERAIPYRGTMYDSFL